MPIFWTIKTFSLSKLKNKKKLIEKKNKLFKSFFLNSFKKLFETFQEGTKLPDIIGVTEIKLDEHLAEIDIDGYEFEPCFSNTQAGGVGVYIGNYLDSNIRRDLKLNLDHCEDVWVEIQSNKRKSIIVSAIYRHPKQNFLKFQESFMKTIDGLNKNKMLYYLFGDWNINLIKYNEKNSVKFYSFEMEFDEGWV